MYWNQVKAAKVAGCSGWIVTLDVLKYSWVSYNKQRELSWIVTLDVLKFPYLDDEGNKIPVD